MDQVPLEFDRVSGTRVWVTPEEVRKKEPFPPPPPPSSPPLPLPTHHPSHHPFHHLHLHHHHHQPPVISTTKWSTCGMIRPALFKKLGPSWSLRFLDLQKVLLGLGITGKQNVFVCNIFVIQKCRLPGPPSPPLDPPRRGSVQRLGGSG